MRHPRHLTSQLCPRLGITVPIVGAPMGGVAGPALAAAVSGAGGLGMLGHANTDLDVVRAEIRQVQQLTDRPFGVGLLFPGSPRTTGEASEPPSELPPFLRGLQETVRWSSPPVPKIRRYDRDDAERRLDILLEENVPVLACGLDTPASVVRRAKQRGVQVMSLVGSRRAALEVVERGADVVVAQGHEAGGHTGRTATFVLVPQVVDAVPVPVVAAGGIVDGRGAAAAMMLGASGVLIGTRLLATPEADTAPQHKDRVVAMRDDTTVVSRCYTGKPSRVLRNAFTDAWTGHENDIRPMPQQWEMVEPLVAPAKANGSVELANWPTGQGAVLVDAITPAAEVVRGIAADAAAVMAERVAATTGPARV